MEKTQNDQDMKKNEVISLFVFAVSPMLFVLDGWMDGWKDGSTEGWMDRQMMRNAIVACWCLAVEATNNILLLSITVIQCIILCHC